MLSCARNAVYTSDLGAPGRDHLFGYGLIRFKEVTQPLEKRKSRRTSGKDKEKADIQTAQKRSNRSLQTQINRFEKRLNTVKEQLKKQPKAK
ncbi:hypothetical protein PO124_10250 [Bacillus licheniformis]|nr:hypothetical protein [Bacillus licheniformis]